MSRKVALPSCPLCTTIASSFFLEEPARRFAHCATCDLIFVHPGDRPRPLEEAMRYLDHHNDPANAGYVDFLTKLSGPVCAAMPEGSHGLDFGCGPIPVLASLLSEANRPTESYDPLFHPDGRLLERTYDFVTCSEVVEHAHQPARLFAQMFALLAPGGLLGVMTQLHSGAPAFATWWYRRDFTHVCFYSETTLRWIAEHFWMELVISATNVALFSRVSRDNV